MNSIKDIATDELLGKIFDFKRIINPTKNKCISNNNGLEGINKTCFHFWDKFEECENCISMRAINEDRTMSKIEYVGDKIFMVVAVPIVISNEKVAIELLRDITDSDMLRDLKLEKSLEIYEEVERLNKLVVTDELTGCYNRRYLNEKLPVELQKGEKVALCMLDIDYFKSINDRYGHLVGDLVLKSFANKIRQYLDPSEWCCRVGGEEFIIVMKYSNKIEIKKRIKNLHQDIRDMDIYAKNEKINVTCSIGVKFLKDTKEDIKDIFNMVDEKLYDAKESGRNKIIYQ